MPYIIKELREKVDKELDELVEKVLQIEVDKRDGVLNYIICRLVSLVLLPDSYLDYERVVGLLECAKLEIVRRGLYPYEDVKREVNGDVFE